MDKLGFYEDTAKHFVALLVSVLFFLTHKCQNSKLSFKLHFSYKLLFWPATTDCVPWKVFSFGKKRQNLKKENVIPVDLFYIQTSQQDQMTKLCKMFFKISTKATFKYPLFTKSPNPTFFQWLLHQQSSWLTVVDLCSVSGCPSCLATLSYFPQPPTLLFASLYPFLCNT